MRRSMICIVALAWGALTLVGEPAAARAQQPGAAAARAAEAADSAPSRTNSTSTADPVPGASGETWRYRRHQGQWWYWLPSEKWVVWNGERWVAHVPQVSTQSSTRSSTSRGGRYDYPPQQGNWGPVHYDRWGNRQYPYSRRKSGLQQLGPVPAMGGVRSLPGWGGER